MKLVDFICLCINRSFGIRNGEKLWQKTRIFLLCIIDRNLFGINWASAYRTHFTEALIRIFNSALFTISFSEPFPSGPTFSSSEYQNKHHIHQINTCKSLWKVLSCSSAHTHVYLCTVAASLKGTESKMKLWDILATCLLLLSSVSARPLFHKLQPSKRAVVRSESPALDPIIDSQPETTNQKHASMEEQCKSECMHYLVDQPIEPLYGVNVLHLNCNGEFLRAVFNYLHSCMLSNPDTDARLWQYTGQEYVKCASAETFPS